jgi:prepilin-type N-terminal cleavage/methylation domain-containing protein
MDRCKKNGFSLLELLTVLAIIGILIAILVPTVAGVRNSAQKAKSKVQFSQWALAMEAFRQEYGYYPNVGTSGLLDPQKFVREMTGLEIDGTDPVVVYGNVKKIRFYDFTRDVLVQTSGQTIVDSPLTNAGARLIDDFENTEIGLVIDLDYDGEVTVTTSDTVKEGINPSGGVGVSPVSADTVIRSGIVFFTAGSGEHAEDLLKSWE